MTPNYELLEAKIYHGLKSLPQKGDVLQPRYLEISICDSLGFLHVGDSTFYADGVKDQIQLSVKTRKLSPQKLKRKEGRDFQTHRSKFLGPQINKKQNKITAGLEIVQRRQQLNLKNDSTAIPQIVGEATISGFLANVQESKQKFNVSQTIEVIGIHGYDKTGDFYLLSLFWKEQVIYDLDKITWVREGSGVAGYIDDNGVTKKIYERINGNAKREATCFKEFKDLTDYENVLEIKVPIPDLFPFDLNATLAEIRSKKNNEQSS